MHNQTFYYTTGLPASGKSTWAKEEVSKSHGNLKRVNKDDLRAMLDNSIHSKPSEAFVLTIRDNIIINALKQGFSVVSDDTNFGDRHIPRFQQIVADYNREFKRNVPIIHKDFTGVSPLECIKRDQNRAASVGAKVIMDMYNRYVKKPFPKYVAPSYDLPAIMICDLDGTLAILNGRNPYDATTCDQDEVNRPVQQMLSLYIGEGVIEKIVFFSGREDKYREPTIRFLEYSCGFLNTEYELHMRATGDMRNDAIIKKELFYAHVHGKYDPVVWLDDRQQVCEMVRRDIGVPLWQVNEGLF